MLLPFQVIDWSSEGSGRLLLIPTLIVCSVLALEFSSLKHARNYGSAIAFKKGLRTSVRFKISLVSAPARSRLFVLRGAESFDDAEALREASSASSNILRFSSLNIERRL